MKRKIFSKLLMGAFLIASVSSFVSCKDYDDDINNLQKQIDAAALKAELTTLQQTLAAQIAAAQSAAERAQAAAEAAQKTADGAATKEALESVKTIATNAGAAAAQAIADAANAKAAADAAQATANNAGTAAEKAAADAAKGIADAAAAQNTANVAQTAAAAAQKAAEVAQKAADGANTNATKALADAATALANAAAAQDAAKGAQGTADAATASAKAGNEAAAKAQATAETAVAAAANAAAQAAEALAAAQAAQVAAAEATNSNEAIRGLLEKANKYADDAAAAALNAAEAALAASEEAAAAKDEAAEAKKAVEEATEAITKATDAKIAAAVAEVIKDQANVDKAQDAAQKVAIETLQGNIQTLADTFADYATAEALEEAVAGLEEDLDAAVSEAAIAAAAAAAGTIKDAVEMLYSAVTSVELVASYSADDFDEDVVTFPFGVQGGAYSGVSLDFFFGKQLFDSKFGDKDTESLDQDADNIITYKKGDDIRTNMALLVRVNPTNATFTKDQIKFVNSKLETLDEIVEIGEPKRFAGMITTRADQQNGLWVIPVSVKKDVKFNDFNEKTFYKGGSAWIEDDYVKADGNGLLKGDLNIYGSVSQKLYAIAINNTTDPEDAEISRYVTSTYDIAAAYKHYTPATYIDAEFAYIENKIWQFPDLGDVHNRWTSDVENGEPDDSWGIRSYDQKIAYTLLNPEKTWSLSFNDKEKAAGLFSPTDVPVKADVDGKDAWNTVNDQFDERYESPMLHVEQIGNTVKVSLAAPFLKHQYSENLQQKVEYWYISYDFEKNAVESKPSEWEAWRSYADGIDGLYKMHRGSQTIDLTINKQTADGDVIGFRVWAVNYDGSLVDPDGRAFYVKIGKDAEQKKNTVEAEFMAVNAEKELGAASKLGTTNIDPAHGFNVSGLVDISEKTKGFGSLALSENSGKTLVEEKDGKNKEDVYVYWTLLDSKGKPATNWNDIKSLAVGVDGADLGNIVDGATLEVKTISDKRTDANKQEVYTLTINAKKVMPTAEFAKKNFYDGIFTWHKDYDPVTNVMTIYPKPYKEISPVQVLNPVNYGKDGKVDFYWRGDGNTGAWDLWSWYEDETYLDWDGTIDNKLANAGIRKIQDYNYVPKDDAPEGFDGSRYYFEFKGLPHGIDKLAAQNYKTYWGEEPVQKPKFGNNSFVAVMPEVIRTDKDADLFYTFEGISLTYDSKKKEYDGAKDYPLSVWTFTASFKDALDLIEVKSDYPVMKYTTWRNNGYGNPTIDKQEVVKTDGTLYISWKNGIGDDFSLETSSENEHDLLLYTLAAADYTWPLGTNPYTTAAWDQDADKDDAVGFRPDQIEVDYTAFNTVSNDLTTILKVYISESNAVLATGVKDGNNQWSGAGLQYGSTDPDNLQPFDPSYFSFDNPATKNKVENAMTCKLSGDITTYLRIAEGSEIDALTVNKVGGVSDPTRNISGTLTLTGYDVFGKKHEFNIPVCIVYNF